MTPKDKKDLREFRDAIEDEDDKRLVRKTINYIAALEAKVHAVKTLARAISNEASLNNMEVDGGD